MNTNLEAVVGQIAASYFGHNSVKTSEIRDIIVEIRKGLTDDIEALEQDVEIAEPLNEHKSPQEIKRSVTPDAIYSFIDGKPYKSLTRHIKIHGFPDARAYRQYYGLKADYPMTAPSYSETRAELARKMRLGKPGQEPAQPPQTPSKQQKPRVAA